MTRDNAKTFLASMGITDPTDEQISNLLNAIGSETSKAKALADKYKADADKVTDLQKQLDDINAQNLSDVERANKEVEKANQKVAELEKSIKTMQLKADLAGKGIIGENADKLVESLSNGSLDVELLGQIISERETSAIANFEQKNLDGTLNPEGGKGNPDNDDTDPDVANAKLLNFGSTATAEERDYYKL